MPISPANMTKYPGGSIRSPEWLAIREQVRERAGDRCEGCGVINRSVGWRDDEGCFHNSVARDDLDRMPGAKYIKIVCTVAHLDGQLVDHSLDNLRFWCQRCHNRHDAKARSLNAQATNRSKRATGELL